MPHVKALDRHWIRDRVSLELHNGGLERAYAMGFAAAHGTLERRIRRLLNKRRRDLIESNPRVALDGRCELVLTMPKQIKALEHGAHVALLCALEDLERAARNEWWDEKDSEDERLEKVNK